MAEPHALAIARGAGKTIALTQAAIDTARAEAYDHGWIAGCADVMRELERRGCFTTTRARREVERLRSRLGNPTDMVESPVEVQETR